MFDSPIPDALYDKAYDLAMESCDLEDEEKFDESSKTRANDKETHVRAEKSSDKTTANGESESNDYNAVTCLYPKEPETEMIVNHSDVRKRVKLKRKAKKIIDYAPGEK